MASTNISNPAGRIVIYSRVEATLKSKMGLNSNMHIWAPDLFSFTGGIQAFSRYLIDAVRAEAVSSRFRVLIKNDLPDGIPDKQVTHEFNAYGHWPARLRSPRLALECLRHVWRVRHA